jgi:protein SSD1
MLDACIAGGGADAKFGMDREQVAKCAQQCNMKKGKPIPRLFALTLLDSAKLAQEQSAHLHLCLLVHDLTERYGPVIRPATVIGVLDAAFDVVVVSDRSSLKPVLTK